MSNLLDIQMHHRYTFTYTNHANVTEVRTVEPVKLQFGVVQPYYPEPTWLLRCWDLDREAYRSFDVSKIKDITLV